MKNLISFRHLHKKDLNNLAKSAPSDFDEVTRQMERRHEEGFRSLANHGCAYFGMTSLFLVVACLTDFIEQTITQQVFLTGYTAVGLFCCLMSRMFDGMKFDMLVLLGIWMHSSAFFHVVTYEWPCFQYFILAVTAFVMVLPAGLITRLTRQKTNARKRTSQITVAEAGVFDRVLMLLLAFA